ncbi:MAG: VWA domain-containing protein [Pirellulales bacterium]
MQPAKRLTVRRRGAMLILLAAMMFAFLVTVAFAVDIAYMHLVRGELRTATDAASKAAAVTLSSTGDRNQAVAAGQQIALSNKVAGSGLQLSGADFVFGHSTLGVDGRFSFQAGTKPFNSVQVLGARTKSSLSGEVPLFFGGAFGVSGFQPSHRAVATFVERDVALVLDRSGSMSGTKIRDLKSAVRLFVSLLDSNDVEEFVGLASYSTFATEDVQLTKTLANISNSSDGMIANGSTSISGGIQSGFNILKRGRSPEFVERTMILMTDGIHNTGIDPEIPAASVAAEGIVIHTIAFGTDADFGRMQQIAAIGHGRAFKADNGTQLNQVFREIALTLSTIMTE